MCLKKFIRSTIENHDFLGASAELSSNCTVQENRPGNQCQQMSLKWDISFVLLSMKCIFLLGGIFQIFPKYTQQPTYISPIWCSMSKNSNCTCKTHYLILISFKKFCLHITPNFKLVKYSWKILEFNFYNHKILLFEILASCNAFSKMTMFISQHIKIG